MVAEVNADGPGSPSVLERYYGVNPVLRVGIRWLLIIALTALAFHQTFASLAVTTREGGLGGYIWTVPLITALVAIAVARRNRTELPIHDRQTDIIVGVMGLGMAVLIQAALLERYALYFHVLRLDVVAAGLFVLSCCIVLFGLRPVIRFAWVWAMVVLAFPLPYFLVVVLLGGGKFAAGAATLLIAAIGTGTAVGRTFRRGVIGWLGAWVVGFAVLIAITELTPDAPMVVYQQVPAVTALSVVSLVMYFRSRRGAPKRLLDRRVEPLAAKQVWSGVPLVAMVALVLASCSLPAQVSTAPVSRSSPERLEQGRPLNVPSGWTVTQRHTYPQVRRLYGDGAVLVRQYMLANAGDPRWDKLSRPRTVVVDSTVSRRPFSFDTYPARVLYGLTSARISAPRHVDLGSGVTARLVSVVDDNLLVTWNSVQFAWGDSTIAQRVTIFAVDNHDPDAPFPTPSTNVASNLRTLTTLLFRGNAVLDQRVPVFKDEQMLTIFAHALIAAQIV